MELDTDTLIPDTMPEQGIDHESVRTVTHVTRGGPVAFGRAVQFELAFADGSRETLRTGCGDLPKIVSELRGFASITERASRASRDRPVEVVNPYQVTDARTDRIGPMIVVRLPTTDGIPLLIAMDHTVADKLMLGLEQELARAARR
jgi:hypothetical protein